MILLYWGLSAGNVSVQVSGDASAGGAKQHVTSEFFNARMTAAFTAIVHGFFVAVLFGMPVLRDLDSGIVPLLRSSKLSTTEYLMGKLLACLMTLALVLGSAILLAIFFNHVMPHPGREAYFGDFKFANYWKPYFKFSLPHLLMIGGVSFAIGIVVRKPILVFFFPVVVLIAFLFLMQWSPTWMPVWANELVMCVEPSGFRWLNEKHFSVDRGTEFYNLQTIELDSVFLLSRLALAGIGLAAIGVAVPLFSRSVRGARNGAVEAIKLAPAITRSSVQDAVGPGLAALGMSQRNTSLLADIWTITRYELKELRNSPALYLFIPFILIEVIGTSFLNEGPFGTALLHTSGGLATMTMETLSIYGCLLLMFYTIESQLRERIKKLSPIYFSTQAKSFSMLMGKTLANAGVAFLIIAASLVACFVVLLIQGTVSVDVVPFVLVWGIMLLPTYIMWSAFITMVIILTRSRYTSYAIGAAAFIGTLYLQFTDKMTWLTNWRLSAATNWSDISILEMDRTMIVLNRCFVLTLAVLFIYVASRVYWRRGFDAVQIATRAKLGNLLWMGAKALPFVVLPIILGSMIWARVQYGYQGESVETQQRDYWRENVATWTDVDTLSIAGVNVSLDIEPEQQSMSVAGYVRLRNENNEPVDSFCLTIGSHWQDVQWKIDEAFAFSNSQLSTSERNLEMLRRAARQQPEEASGGESERDDDVSVPDGNHLIELETDDRSGLHVFHLAKPLRPNKSLRIEYSFHGKFPDGASKNGGGGMEFILPSGVVLTSFGPTFLPVPGFQETVGLDEEMTPNSEQKDFDFYEEELKSGLGSGGDYHVRTTITGPEDFQFNGVGVLKSDEVADGRRTVIWESDQPVSFFNVVGGRWKVHKGEATEIYYSEAHPYNVEEMSEALEAARVWFSKWFAPYPWKELRLSEFPNMASYAQGFPTNITFSEGIGFLTRVKSGSNAPFMVTAHEAAHQWWGNILTPGDGPGGNILSEGTAHFSAGLLLGQVKGDFARMEFFKDIEDSYGRSRNVDAERPMVEVDGSKQGDQTVTYDKGGWVFWMLMNHLGRRDALQGFQAFIAKYRDNKDHPVLQDFLILMREFAKDKDSYDQFVRQWFLDTVVPEYKLREMKRTQEGSTWIVSGVVENTGTGTMELEVAAAANERFVDGKASEEYREERTTILIGASDKIPIELRCNFEPDRVYVDPDVKVLQLNRKLAEHSF